MTWASDADFTNVIDTESLPADTTSWTLSGLSADTQYHIKVEAVE